MPLYPGTPYEYSASSGGLVFTAGACPLLGVSFLGYPEQLVEIEAIAATGS